MILPWTFKAVLEASMLSVPSKEIPNIFLAVAKPAASVAIPALSANAIVPRVKSVSPLPSPENLDAERVPSFALNFNVLFVFNL